MSRIVIDQDFPGPAQRVFDHLAKHENFGPIFGAKVRRIKDGEGHRDGVGSARSLKVGPLPAFVETTTDYVPYELIRYRITSGPTPLRDHRAEMRFSESAEMTHLHYEIEFGAVVPGLDALIARVLERNIRKGLRFV